MDIKKKLSSIERENSKQHTSSNIPVIHSHRKFQVRNTKLPSEAVNTTIQTNVRRNLRDLLIDIPVDANTVRHHIRTPISATKTEGFTSYAPLRTDSSLEKKIRFIFDGGDSIDLINDDQTFYNTGTDKNFTAKNI